MIGVPLGTATGIPSIVTLTSSSAITSSLNSADHPRLLRRFEHEGHETFLRALRALRGFVVNAAGAPSVRELCAADQRCPLNARQRRLPRARDIRLELGPELLDPAH